MKNTITTFTLGSGLWLLSAATAAAGSDEKCGSHDRCGGTVNVPEIDAASGLLALAAVAAALLLVWEMRRRRAA